MVCYFVLYICFVRIFVIVCICLYVYLYVWIQDTTEDQHCLLMWLILSKYFTITITTFRNVCHHISIQTAEKMRPDSVGLSRSPTVKKFVG